MSRVVRWSAGAAPPVDDVADVVSTAGGVALVPTDTVYGLAARISDEAAIARIFSLKDRPAERSIPVLVASLPQAEMLADLDDVERHVAETMWPGPLTLILRARRESPVSDAAGTVGVRCPDHVLIRRIAERVGPLAVTSANRHGEPTPHSVDAAAAMLTGDVDLVVDGGDCAGEASTVVRVSPGLTVLRTGAVGIEELEVVMERLGRADP
ncbi:MAG: L-threonylcarbamoyladenylate synthase [Acidimicrobiia bacterium]|nr:L-threonylcarbamoyladenylate synthase [Acidimicrobiia bacterium]